MKTNVEGYMAEHQHDIDALDLWTYYQRVFAWVKATFPVYRKEMKGLAWGEFYNTYKDVEFDADKLEEQIHVLMADDDVTKKSGVYAYVLSGDATHLNIRKFTDAQKREAYERQNGVCLVCDEHFELSEMHADHIVPWSLGGKTTSENCRMLCAADNLGRNGSQ